AVRAERDGAVPRRDRTAATRAAHRRTVPDPRRRRTCRCTSATATLTDDPWPIGRTLGGVERCGCARRLAGALSSDPFRARPPPQRPLGQVAPVNGPAAAAESPPRPASAPMGAGWPDAAAREGLDGHATRPIVRRATVEVAAPRSVTAVDRPRRDRLEGAA